MTLTVPTVAHAILTEINPIQSQFSDRDLRMQITSDLKKNVHRGEFPKVTNVCRNLACKTLRCASLRGDFFFGHTMCINLFIFCFFFGRGHSSRRSAGKRRYPSFFKGRCQLMT